MIEGKSLELYRARVPGGCHRRCHQPPGCWKVQRREWMVTRWEDCCLYDPDRIAARRDDCCLYGW
jgi:hypothetical protein